MSLSNREIVERLAGSSLYQDYACAFAGAVGIPLIFVPRSDEAGAWRSSERASLRRAPRRGKAEVASAPLRNSLVSGREIEPAIASVLSACESFGSMVPVKLGSRWIGCLGPQLPFPAVPSAARTPPDVPLPAKHQAMIDLLRVFAAHLALAGNQILLKEQATEPPIITRVKRFIAQHLVENIRLADAAHIAHMSTCYFCKVFRRTTGLAFTDYLSRLRIERARLRLLDRHLRVSEIAFETGFQSLSQFNRVFKRVTGGCPTEYRRDVENQAAPALRSAVAIPPRPERARSGVIARDAASMRSRFPGTGA